VLPSFRSKAENFAANLDKEPYATKLAIGNILLLIVGFSLSLVVLACTTRKCKQAGNYGQLVIGFAALLLACVETYMRFLVAKPKT